MNVPLGDGASASGIVRDRALEPSPDYNAWADLMEQTDPLARRLRRMLYPSRDDTPRMLSRMTSGQLDPLRLPLAGVDDAVFRRFRSAEHAGQGEPLLLIACDGSASLSAPQMRAVKIFAAAFLDSAAHSHVRVMAGVYNSERETPASDPVVRWVYHPDKSLARSARAATHALVSLGNKGFGKQSDVLSLKFMLDEATAVAGPHRAIYLVIVSDTEYNACSHTGMSGTEEMRGFLKTAAADLGARLHVTLVALSVSGATQLDDVVDDTVAVPKAELTDSTAMAERVGVYGASCIRTRSSRTIQRRKP